MLSTEIEKWLPYLRRYARALTGSTALGDKAVIRALESLDPDETFPEIEVAMFHRLDRTIVEHHDSLRQQSEETPLADLDPPERRALLLKAVEEFSIEQTAQIMGTYPEHVEALLADSENKILAGLATTLMIVEDEPLIAASLSRLSQSLGHKLAGVATTKDKAVEMALSYRPTVILCDVKLADNSLGNEAVAEISETYEPIVIYITAYPERLLSGQAGEPAYLIPKPFKPAYVKAVLEQALLSASGAPGENASA